MVDEASRQRAEGHRHAEPAGAGRTAGVHPGRRRAARDGQLRAGRARADGEGQHRHLREDGRARRRLHPEDRPDDLHRELEGPVRLLSRRRSGLRAHVPHGRRQRLRLGGHHRRQGPEPDRREGAHRNRVRQGAQEPQGQGDRAGPLHRHPRAARQRALPVADDRHLQSRAAGAAAGVAGAAVAAAVAAADGPAAGAARHAPSATSSSATVHAQERHRQHDPAADDDPARLHAGQAGDVGREGHAQELRHARGRRERRT